MSENKGDLISQSAALAELSGLCENWEDEDCTSYQALDIVQNLPAVDAQPVVHGRLAYEIDFEDEADRDDFDLICTNCASFVYECYSREEAENMKAECHYCISCGAKMDGGDTHV